MFLEWRPLRSSGRISSLRSLCITSGNFRILSFFRAEHPWEYRGQDVELFRAEALGILLIWGNSQDLGLSNLEISEFELFRAEISGNVHFFDYVGADSLRSIQDLGLSDATSVGIWALLCRNAWEFRLDSERIKHAPN